MTPRPSICAGLPILLAAAAAPGQTTQPAAGVPDVPPAPPLRGPTYQPLRWNDDFSYLADDAPHAEDLFDPIKYVAFAPDWSLSVGGALRGRLESRTNNFINLADPTQDTTLLHRYFLHTDVRYRQLLRFYAEGIFAAIEDNDSPPLAINENRGDFHQYFVDVRPLGEEVPLTARIGRQELLYGKQRLISPLDWANTRRRFDGFSLMWTDECWNVDAFYAHPVPDVAAGFRNRLDTFDERQRLIGLYATYKGMPGHGVDLYYLHYRNANEPVSADGNIGSLSLNTFGGRFWGRAGPWDYDTELAGQFGDFAGDTVQAWAWAAEGGYTFREVDWTPRLGLGIDYASGDADPDDGKHQTFNQLFPLGHAYLGYIDLVARQNVWAGQANVTVKPRDDVTVRAAYHAFWLAQVADGLFNAGGVPLRRDPTGSASRDIGHELDLTVIWKIDRHSALLLGYSHFWNGGFINDTGFGDDADFVYVQYEFKF